MRQSGNETINLRLREINEGSAYVVHRLTVVDTKQHKNTKNTLEVRVNTVGVLTFQAVTPPDTDSPGLV